MPQLPGQACTLCGDRISGAVDGMFCRECGSPVHKQCLARRSGKRGTCEHCGTPDVVSSALQEQEREQCIQHAIETQRVDTNNDVTLGVLCLIGGVVFTAVSYLLAVRLGVGHYLVATGLIGVGLYRLISGIDHWRFLKARSDRDDRDSEEA